MLYLGLKLFAFWLAQKLFLALLHQLLNLMMLGLEPAYRLICRLHLLLKHHLALLHGFQHGTKFCLDATLHCLD